MIEKKTVVLYYDEIEYKGFSRLFEIWKAKGIIIACHKWYGNILFLLIDRWLNIDYRLVSGGCRIHRLHLCRGVRSHKRVSWNDLKQSDGEAPIILELWGIQSTPSLPSFTYPLWPGVVAPNRVLTNNMLNWIVWNRTVWSFDRE